MSPDYAPVATAPTTASTPLLRPSILPTLAATLLIAVFIAAGQWQWNKAAAKESLQQQLDSLGAEQAIQLPLTPVDSETLRYRKVIAQGVYEPQFQILIDNRTYNGQAGFHVITPLRLTGSELRVLVNRGWVPALAEHRLVPPVATPGGAVEVTGTAIVPATRFFTLGADATALQSDWQRVWPNLDLARYGKAVSFPIQPVVIQLAPESGAGGFTREWPRPDNRAQANLGYALQWWAFAATTLALWLFFTFRRATRNS